MHIMAGRGRPKLSEEDKAARKEERELNAARDWGAKMPKDDEQRTEAFVILRANEQKLKDTTAKAKESVTEARDRLTKQHGWHKAVIAFDALMEKQSAGVRAMIWRQLKQRSKDAFWDTQFDMFDESGGVGEQGSDTGPVMDSANVGERQAAERGDDPGRARKRSGGPPPAPVDTGSLDNSPRGEAEKLFEAASKPKGDNVVTLKPNPPAAPADEEDERDLRARFMQPQEEPAPAPKAKRSRAKADKSSTGSTYREVG